MVHLQPAPEAHHGAEQRYLFDHHPYSHTSMSSNLSSILFASFRTPSSRLGSVGMATAADAQARVSHSGLATTSSERRIRHALKYDLFAADEREPLRPYRHLNGAPGPLGRGLSPPPRPATSLRPSPTGSPSPTPPAGPPRSRSTSPLT